jgi:hypothetical protein
VPAQPVDATPSAINLFSQGGVYDVSETSEAFRGAEDRHVVPQERPAEIEDRAIPGHWEGDLLGGTHNSHIATLVERHSRFTALVKVPSKDTAAVVAALSRHVRKLGTFLKGFYLLCDALGVDALQTRYSAFTSSRILPPTEYRWSSRSL